MIDKIKRLFETKKVYLVLIIALIAVALAGIAVIMRQTNEDIVYAWQDDSGQQYVTTQTRDSLAPENIYPGHAEVRLIKVDGTASPLKTKTGYITVTYKLVNPPVAVYQLAENSGHRTIYLIGETHLGKSQKAVAKIITDIINTYEIDAIFLEQPESLNYDWSKYKSLEGQPDNAIYALQEQMLIDAEKPMQLDFGKYQKYYDDAKPKTKEELIAVMKQIVTENGEEGLLIVKAALENLTKIDETHKYYEESKYISAADYLYIMLNLKGIKIPFYNVESDSLRSDFKSTLSSSHDTTDRDIHMVNKSKGIIQSNNYHRVILICGALHIDNLKEMFTKLNYDVKVAYNSLEDKFKVDEAVLVNPDYVNEIAKKGPSAGFAPQPESIVESVPTKQIMGSIDKYFETNGNSFFTPTERTGLKDSFLQEFKAKQLKGAQDWKIDVTFGGKTLIISKHSGEDSLKIESTPLIDLNKSIARNANSDRQREYLWNNRQYNELIGKTSMNGFTYGIVENQSTNDKKLTNTLYNGKNEPQSYFKVTEIVDAMIEKNPTNRVIYLALDGYTPKQVKSFENTVNVHLEKPEKAAYKVIILDNPKSPDVRTFLETPVEIQSASEVTEETSGRFDKLFKFVITFLTPNKQEKIMNVYARTKETALKLIQDIKSMIIQQNANVSKMTMAENATLMMSKLLSNKDIVITVDDLKNQFGEVQIVRIFMLEKQKAI
ncbi:hypothetical protein [Candidatus Magnetominusculus xianensis]|uniref:Uncharacterized protein n=1 Tax=Candidatus Magnetominusculus xianensis TaxID=1748249 RepID=A0ABR5SFK2_9BACT|nr:hypothetical protein [Candidatus Magnetominusculus xianensis]KWT83008.1 hypothetical protein ASN18_2282 [Candidatus Magnetominusculus xianensis]MBF0402718.1 hypothetical protein [Nitrospirota bacterium]